jgi:predicted glycogen debranching enzyme
MRRKQATDPREHGTAAVEEPPRETPARELAQPQLEPQPAASLDTLVAREWLVTNGLGGYAAGTVAGVQTRRYHGLLVAALPAPLGRMLVLGQLSEVVRFPDGLIVRLGGERRVGDGPNLPGLNHLAEFRLEAGLPIWRYLVEGWLMEKRLFMAHLQNTVHVLYRVLSAGDRRGPVRVEMHPTVAFRPHDAPVSTPLGVPFTLRATAGRYEVTSAWPALPPLRLALAGAEPTFTCAARTLGGVHYMVEERRGYEAVGELWTPGYFGADLAAGSQAALTASTEPWDTIAALSPAEALAAEMERRERLVAAADPRAQEGMGAELVLAADQFVITPGRLEDRARARAAGDEARSVIAGYHWFTDWGRDTMISLEGLTLATGRGLEAGWILRTFARHVRDGLIPNLFPEGEREGVYHTADASLWFFHALSRYLAATGDRETLELLAPKLIEIVDHHLAGTRFGIGVDPADGLLRQGAEGFQLTWMDAKVDDWVVTPRRGKAVEINALWYNALRLLAGWLGELRGPGDPEAERVAAAAERARESFNRRFWYAPGGFLYDVVDGPAGDDPSCRPNQIFAVSLPHPVLDAGRWEAVVETVRERLLTPVGLRSLARGEPAYKPAYDGDLRARDAAYHQGTVWAWLIGPFVDAWLRSHPGDRATARGFLAGFMPHLGEACLGQISEIFDAEPPWIPRGCVAQAWSVAEVLRVWVATTAPPGSAGSV